MQSLSIVCQKMLNLQHATGSNLKVISLSAPNVAPYESEIVLI